MTVWFTSDLHLGHRRIVEDEDFRSRPFDTIEEHDETIIENINKVVKKKEKLFILGDVAFTQGGIKWANTIRCQNVELILGNHDKFPLRVYNGLLGWKVHGFRGYKNYWLSHCPIHPFEIRKKVANLHGHVHKFSDTAKIVDMRYYNVNTEFHSFKPVNIEAINEHFRIMTRKQSIRRGAEVLSK